MENTNSERPRFVGKPPVVDFLLVPSDRFYQWLEWQNKKAMKRKAKY